MPLNICKTICKECPFTTTSPRGWLGPHTLEEVIDTQQKSELFSCHLLRKEDMSRQDIESGKVRICRGYIASATKSGLYFDDETETGRALRELQELVYEEEKEDGSAILSSREFIRHHGRSMPYEELSKQEWLKRLGYKEPACK